MSEANSSSLRTRQSEKTSQPGDSTTSGTRCLVAGSFGFGNLGDEAVCPALSDLARVCGRSDIEFIPLSRFDNPDSSDVVSRRASIQERLPDLFGLPVLYVGGGVIEPRERCVLLALEEAMRIIQPSRQMIFAASAESGVKFSFRWRRRIRRVINRCDAVSVRDLASSEALSDEVGVQSQTVCGDCILALECGASSNQIQINNDRRYIAVNLAPRWENDIVWWTGLAQELEVIARDLDANIIFMPMSSSNDSDNRMHLVVRNLFRDSLVKDHAMIIPHSLTARQTLRIFSDACLAVTMRLHATVMASSVHTPVIPIPYHPKIVGYLRTVGLQQCIPHQSMLLKESIVSKGYTRPPVGGAHGWLRQSVTSAMKQDFGGVESSKSVLRSHFSQVVLPWLLC